MHAKDSRFSSDQLAMSGVLMVRRNNPTTVGFGSKRSGSEGIFGRLVMGEMGMGVGEAVGGVGEGRGSG